MPRVRKGSTATTVEASNTAVEVTPSATGVTPPTNNGQTHQGERIKMALTNEQIQALLANTRSKGQYTEYLNSFIASGESGVCANDEWVAIRDKKATTIKQGFENAKDKKDVAEGAEFVKVISNEDKVYLINLKAAGVDMPAEAAAA